MSARSRSRPWFNTCPAARHHCLPPTTYLTISYCTPVYPRCLWCGRYEVSVQIEPPLPPYLTERHLIRALYPLPYWLTHEWIEPSHESLRAALPAALDNRIYFSTLTDPEAFTSSRSINLYSRWLAGIVIRVMRRIFGWDA